MRNLLSLLVAAGLAYLLVAVIGGRAIEWLRRICRERIDTASPTLAALHAGKSGTPSMGGLLIFGCWLSTVALCCDLRQTTVLLCVAVTAAFVALGACDDLIKSRGRSRGMSASMKLAGQLLISTIAVMAGLTCGAITAPGTWLFYIPLAVFLLSAMSNAVNVTDGLDGLAAGCGTLAAVTLAAVALATGAWLVPSTVADSQQHQQLAMLAAALAGALAAFLRFNRSPACVFMGDAGALPLGGLLALLGILLRCELLLLLVGGVFVAELASVVLQVGWFRHTGRRLFRCAPLHHHFEFLGWPEPIIVRRFWLAAASFALAGLLFASLRVGWTLPPTAVPRVGEREA
ncbi:MAG: phospho-N-acetylmuramoyl-pentapeptide-transferase [Pirellulales bacterium]